MLNAASRGLPARTAAGPDIHDRVAASVAGFADEVRVLKQRRLKPAVFREWERILEAVILPVFGPLELDALSPELIAAWISDLEDAGLAASSIRSYLKPLSAIVKLALRRGLLELNPLSLLDADERPQAAARRRPYEWTPETISQLLIHARLRGERPQARYAYYPLLATLTLTGARVSEVLALRQQDIDLDRRLIRIRHSWSRNGTLTVPKTAAAVREIPIPPQLEALFQTFLVPSAHRWVFPSRTGRLPLSYWNLVKRGLVPALDAAGLADKGIRLHDLRHAAASLLIAEGLTPVEVAAQLGHADPGVTMRVYAHLFDRRRSHERTRAAFATVQLQLIDDGRSRLSGRTPSQPASSGQ